MKTPMYVSIEIHLCGCYQYFKTTKCDRYKIKTNHLGNRWNSEEMVSVRNWNYCTSALYVIRCENQVQFSSQLMSWLFYIFVLLCLNRTFYLSYFKILWWVKQMESISSSPFFLPKIFTKSFDPWRSNRPNIK
jgi:hypothetical protein